MRRDVDARLAALLAEVERRRQFELEPVDPLSASLYAFAEELAGLDEIGIAALAGMADEDGKPILTLTQTQQMAADYRKEVSTRKVAKLHEI